MELLPRDSLLDIFRFVGIGDYSSLSLVCKDFYYLIRSNRQMNHYRILYDHATYSVGLAMKELYFRDGSFKIPNKKLIRSLLVWTLTHNLKMLFIVRKETYFIYTSIIRKLEFMLRKKFFLRPHPQYSKADSMLIAEKGVNLVLKKYRGVLLTKGQASSKFIDSLKEAGNVVIVQDDSSPNAQCPMVIMDSFTKESCRNIIIFCCRKKCT